jgi:hypothetical protein
VAQALQKPTGEVVDPAGLEQNSMGSGGQGGGTSSANRRYSLTVSMQIRNLTNHNNPGPIIGNITSPLFGQSNQPARSGGGEFRRAPTTGGWSCRRGSPSREERLSMLRSVIQFLVLFCFIQILIYAQDTGVAITGTVLDPHQAGVLGARVTLKRAGSNAVQTTKVDGLGAFRFDGVAPGNYEVRIEQEGFKPNVSRLRVGNQPPRPMNVVLALEDVQQQVTVGAELTQVSTNTSDNLDTITMNRQSLDDLPIFDQDYIGTMSRFLDAASVGTSGVTLVVDGVEATRAGVSASAIQEVKINQDPYSAEYPRPGKGRIEIITKPGSSEFHGTFNFLFRDNYLNAREPFALVRPPEQRRIFEGSFTGPLGRGKRTSFLISANREEEDAQAIVFALGPSGEIRETVPAPQRNTELGGSLNHQFSGDQLISIRGMYTDRTIRNQGVGGLTLPEAGTNFEDREDLVTFNHRGSITKKWFNQFRFYAARQHTPAKSINPGPNLVVLGAFTGGGAHGDRLQTENHITLN